MTGSRYLLARGKDSLLVDAGLFQGLKSLRLKNWDPVAFDAKSLGWVALTHAHIDHCGYLPRLVRSGFKGRVLCTPPTADLLPLMLMDTAKLQEEDAKYLNRTGQSKHKPALPLFTSEDVLKTVALLEPVDYGVKKELGAGLSVEFIDVGHILGSAMVLAEASEAGKRVRVLFSGDVGRYDMPLPPDPLPPPECDALVIESTYGNRQHGSARPEDELEKVVKEIVKNSGILLIPAFAVGRSQQILFILRELETAGRIPALPVHLDSPMAYATTDIYLKYLKEGRVRMDRLKGSKSIVGGRIKVHKSVQESRQLAKLKGPAVVISSSGMLAGGRILHHLREFMPRPSTVLAIAGYQAEGTRGRLLLDGARSVRIYGQDIEIKGSVVNLHGFSGHADADELMRWTSSIKQPPKRVFVTHGEEKAALSFAERLRSERGWNASVPSLHEMVDLG